LGTGNSALNMRCNICGRLDALIRSNERLMAALIHKAHVDCSGHSQYREVTEDEVMESLAEHRLLDELLKELD
jgi:hypothetical protein